MNKEENISIVAKSFWVTATVYTALLISMSFIPSSQNWGYNFLAFYPFPLQIAVPILMFLALLPPISGRLFHSGVKIIRIINHQTEIKRNIYFLLITLGFICIFWLWRERTFFLGDGFMMIQWLPSISLVEDIPVNLRHEPFAGLIIWKVYQVIRALDLNDSAIISIQIVSILSGTGVLFFIHRLGKIFWSPFSDANGFHPVSRLLFFSFIIASGSSQLFFGYVETYAPAFLFLIIYIYTSVLYLRGKISAIVPSIIFGILFPLKFGMIIMTPSLLYLYIQEVRKGKIAIAAGSALATIVMSFCLLMLSGYSAAGVLHVLLHSESHIVPFTQTGSEWQAYTMFSLEHLSELVNLFMLLSPFSGFIIIFVMLNKRKEIFALWKKPDYKFLFIISACSLIMLILFNPDIGMSRDWDVMATIGIPLVILAGNLWLILAEDSIKYRLMTIMITLTCFQTALWIGINASEVRSLNRFNTIPDERFWGRKAFNVFEELGIYYRDKSDYKTAIYYYEKFLEHDSTNTRVLTIVADVYRKSGNSDRSFTMLKRAVDLCPANPIPYVNLGIEYSQLKDTANAISCYERAIQIDSTQPKAYANLGIIFLRRKNYQLANQYFTTAINLGMREPVLFRYAGDLCALTGDYGRALEYYDTYLSSNPADKRVQQMRNEIFKNFRAGQQKP